MQDLTTTQRVSPLWMRTIHDSPSLRRMLYFVSTPGEAMPILLPHDGDQTPRIEYRHSFLSTSSGHPILRSNPALPLQEFISGITSNGALMLFLRFDIDINMAVKRLLGTWDNILLTQPPVNSLDITIRFGCPMEYNWQLYMPDPIRVRNSEGIRIGDVMTPFRDAVDRYEQCTGEIFPILGRADQPVLALGNYQFEGTEEVLRALQKANREGKPGERTALATLAV